MAITEFAHAEYDVAAEEAGDGLLVVVAYKPIEGYRLKVRRDGAEIATDFYDSPLEIKRELADGAGFLRLVGRVREELGVDVSDVNALHDAMTAVLTKAYNEHYLRHVERRRALPRPNRVVLGKPLATVRKTVIPVMQDGVVRYVECEDYREGLALKAFVTNEAYRLDPGVADAFSSRLAEVGVDPDRPFIIMSPYDELVGFIYVDDKGEIVVADEYVRPGVNEVFEQYLAGDEIARILDMLDMRAKRLLIKYAKQFYKDVKLDTLIDCLGISRIPVKRVSTAPPRQYIDMILRDWDEVLDILFNRDVFDERMIIVYSGYALENYWIQYACHGFVITPSGTGKTLFADALGIRIDDTTAPGLFGTVTQTERGTAQVIKGKIQGARCLIQIEQMEYRRYSQPLQGILNAMRTGRVVRELAWGEVVARTTSPIVFTNNPVPDRMALMVGDLGKLAGNVQALGGRVQLFVFTTSMRPANRFVKDDDWDWAVTCLRYVRSYRGFVRRLRRLVNDEDVARFLQSMEAEAEIRALAPEFAEPPADELEDVYEFMGAFCRTRKWGLRYHALVRALLPHVPELVKGNLSPLDVLGEAEAAHEELVRLVVSSIHEFVNSVRTIRFADYVKSSTRLVRVVVAAIIKWATENGLVYESGRYRLTVDELRKYIDDSGYRKLGTRALTGRLRTAFIDGGTPRPLLNAGITFRELPGGEVVVEVDMARLRAAIEGMST